MRSSSRNPLADINLRALWSVKGVHGQPAASANPTNPKGGVV
jgi:hypothetical protein